MKKRKQKHSQPARKPEPAPSAAPRVVRTVEQAARGQVTSAVPAGVEIEPVVARRAPMPVLPVVLLGALLYVAYLMVANTAGGFDARVYSPYVSVKQLEDLQPKSSADEQFAQGRRVYTYICVQCHQENGQGNLAMFIPPLAGSEWVLASGPGRLIRIVSKGLGGPISVSGQQYGGAAMFAAGDQLPGDEEQKIQQVAAVLTYIRGSWGNKAPPVTPDQVRAVRAQIQNRTDPWTAEELLKISEDE